MGGAAFVDGFLEALCILHPPQGRSASLIGGLEIGLGFFEPSPGLRGEIRVFESVVETRSIGGGTACRRRKIFALGLTAREASIKSRAAFSLWSRLAILATGLALGHLERARRAMLHFSRAGALRRRLNHRDFNVCFASVSRNRGCNK